MSVPICGVQTLRSLQKRHPIDHRRATLKSAFQHADNALVPPLPTYVWILLGAMAYLLVTGVMRMLAAVAESEITRHDTVRKAHEMRRQYYEQIMNRKNNVNSSVEVLDD